jgi:hypothetical protein
LDPAKQTPARWHVEGQIAQYVALQMEGSWAELVRQRGIRTHVVRETFRHNIWRIYPGEEGGIADLATFEKIATCGLDPAMFVADPPYADCQEFAQELLAAGYRGILAPSAALHNPEAVNLTLFGARRECRHDEDNRRPGYYVPVFQLTDSGAPPPEMLNMTRLIGEEHLGLSDFLDKL